MDGSLRLRQPRGAVMTASSNSSVEVSVVTKTLGSSLELVVSLDWTFDTYVERMTLAFERAVSATLARIDL